jgi:hypothetical protein
MQTTLQSHQGQGLSCSDEYLSYLLNLRQECQNRLDSYQDQGQDWDSSNRNELRRRLRDHERDLRLYGR